MANREIISARYYNQGTHGISIIAALNCGLDWAAYIAADDGESEADCIKLAVERGCKLSEEDARHYFPSIEEPYRR